MHLCILYNVPILYCIRKSCLLFTDFISCINILCVNDLYAIWRTSFKSIYYTSYSVAQNCKLIVYIHMFASWYILHSVSQKPHFCTLLYHLSYFHGVFCVAHKMFIQIITQIELSAYAQYYNVDLIKHS